MPFELLLIEDYHEKVLVTVSSVPFLLLWPGLRGQFIIECLVDLKKNLMKRGLNLLIRHGKPEEIIPTLAKDFASHAVKCLICLSG